MSKEVTLWFTSVDPCGVGQWWCRIVGSQNLIHVFLTKFPTCDFFPVCNMADWNKFKILILPKCFLQTNFEIVPFRGPHKSVLCQGGILIFSTCRCQLPERVHGHCWLHLWMIWLHCNRKVANIWVGFLCSCFTLWVGKEVWFVNCRSRRSMVMDGLLIMAEVSL